MNNKNAMAATDCSVCYEAISAETGSVQMSCSHTFHYSCITKWFESKKSQNQTQNCPCCRSEPPVTGRLPVSEAAAVAVFEWDVEEEDDESEDEEEVAPEPVNPIFAAAARERAAQRFAVMRDILTEDELKNYAASRIAALVKGTSVYRMYRGLKLIKQEAQNSFDTIVECLTVLNEARNELRADKRRVREQEDFMRMGRKGFGNSRATSIQKWWRSLAERRQASAAAHADEEATVSRILSGGLKVVVTWRRTGGHIWERIVHNPEERDAETFNLAVHALPPQSLAFEMARAAIKLQSVWRGHSARSQYATLRSL
jgi:hypothetical protein